MAGSVDPAPQERRAADDRREDRRQSRPGRRITDIASHDGAHVTVQALADYLGLSPKTIMKFIDSGTLTAYRLGTDIRIRTADAISFLEQSRIRPVV